MEPLLIIPAQQVLAISEIFTITQKVLPATLQADGLAGSEKVELISDGGFATGLLTFSANPANGDTVTLGTKVYTFQTSLSPTTGDGNVRIGTAAINTLGHLVDAINKRIVGGGPGVNYGSGTVLNADASAQADDAGGDSMFAIAKLLGFPGTLVATTETSANLSWGPPTLGGGASLVFQGGSAVELTVTNNRIVINFPIRMQVKKEVTAIPVAVTLALGNNV